MKAGSKYHPLYEALTHSGAEEITLSLPEIETRAALLIELARKSDREALLLLAEIVRNYGGTIPGGLTAGAQFLETHDLDVSNLGKDPRDLH